LGFEREEGDAEGRRCEGPNPAQVEAAVQTLQTLVIKVCDINLLPSLGFIPLQTSQTSFYPPSAKIKKFPWRTY